ncbi:MAG: extracellular solute-binding protein [Armatimonadia bacterium]
MRRSTLAAALALTACLALLCTGQAAAKKIVLRVQFLPTRDLAVTPDQKAILAIADAFREKHPNVELLPFEGLVIQGVGAMDSGPLMAMAGGVAPEVLYVNFRQSETYISQKFLYPLDKYVEKWQQEEDISKLIPPQVWQVIKRKGPDNQEHVWSIPYGVVVMALQYRKDLFKKAGLDPNKPPQNWDEMYDFALRMTDPERGVYGLGLATKGSAAWNFMSFLWSAGSDAVVQDKQGNWRAAYDDDGAVKAIQFYWKLRRGKWTRCPNDGEPVPFEIGQTEAQCKKCHRTFTIDELKKEKRLYEGCVDGDPASSLGWQRGKIGMMFQYLRDEYIAQVNPSQVGLAPIPKGPGGESHGEINATMYGINSTITDPEVRDAAWEYIKFYASTEAKRIKTKIFIDSGFAKYVNPQWLTEFGYNDYLREVPKGWADVFQTTVANARPEPYGKNCQLIYIEMTVPIERALQVDDPSADQIRTILKEEVANTNAKLLGRIPPNIQRMRTIITFFVVLFMAIAFITLMRKSLSHYSVQIQSQSSGAKTETVGYKRRRNIYAWMLLLPALVLIGIWQYYPLARGSIMAFQDYRIIAGTAFVGLQNFSEAIFSKDFWLTMYRTLWYAFMMLSLGFCAPIALAVLLHEVPRLKVFYRTLYYLPAVTTGLVIYMLWKQFYDPSPHGFLNSIYGPASEIARELLVLLVAGLGAGLATSFWNNRDREPEKLAWWMWPIYGIVPLWFYRRAEGERATRLWRFANLAAMVVWSAIAVYAVVQGVRITGVWVLFLAALAAAGAVLAFTNPSPSPLKYVVGLISCAATVLVVTYGVQHVWPELFRADTQQFLDDANPVFGIPIFPAIAMVCIILPQIWASVGPGCIIYLAAMRAIPEEMYEAADLDGAGFWTKFWTITVPFLRALIIINFVGAFIGAFRAFEPIFIMTSGGPANATTVLGLEIWRNAYMYLKYGFAVSMAWILGSLLIGFTVMQLRILSRLEFRTASAKD